MSIDRPAAIIRYSRRFFPVTPPAIACGSSQWRVGILASVLLAVLAAGVLTPAATPAQAAGLTVTLLPDSNVSPNENFGAQISRIDPLTGNLPVMTVSLSAKNNAGQATSFTQTVTIPEGRLNAVVNIAASPTNGFSGPGTYTIEAKSGTGASEVSGSAILNIVFDAANITFTVTVPKATYRGWVGQKISIPVAISSTSNLKKGDAINLPNAPDRQIDGFYAASVGKGKTDICGTVGCDFEESVPSKEPYNDNPTFTANFELDLKSGGLYPVGSRDISFFPVLAINKRTDFPLSNKLANVTVQVFENETKFNAAAAAAGQTPQQFAQGGSTVTTNTSGTQGDSLLGGWADILGGGIVSLINAVLSVIVWILRGVIWLIASFIIIPLLEVTLSIDAANISSTIYFGWTLVRDIVNMIFILILIILGFATILKLESYNYRKLLVELILMAILVNFSLVIGRIIIQIADVVQFYFLPQSEGVNGVRELYRILMLDQTQSAINSVSFSTSGALASTIAIIFQFVMELGIVITFGALAVFTVIRIIALWFLLILSPFAYALRVLPATKSKASEWWSNFLKYAFFTPIIAFFLRLAIELHSKGLALTQGSSFGTPSGEIPKTIQDFLAETGPLDAVPFSATLELLINYVVVLGFMWGGIIVASKMSIMGADTVTSLAKRGASAPFSYGWKGTKLAGGFAAQKFHAKTGIELRPSEWKESWTKYRTKRKAEDKVKGGLRAEARLHEPGGFVKKEILSKLGSPEDFYRQFLDPKEYKRMFAGGQPKAMKAYHDAEHVRQGDATTPGLENSLDDTEQAEMRAERATKSAEAGALTAALPTNQVMVDSSDLGEKVRAMIANILEIEGGKDGMLGELRKLHKKPEADALETEIDTIKTQLESGGPVDLDPSTELGKKLKGAIQGLRDTLNKEALSIDVELTTKHLITDANKLAIKTRYQELVSQGNALRAPQSYEHDLERLHLEGEEMNKLKGIQNADQLVALLHEAVRNKNQFRVGAIWKKLANDYNDNEALSHTVDPFAGTNTAEHGDRTNKNKGDSYGSGRVGMEHYMKDVFQGKLGMDRQAALKLTDEIAYINESRNHWANARLVKYAEGGLQYNDENEQAAAAVAEISKKNPRTAMGDNNRLAYGEEIQDRSGNRRFKINKLGKSVGKILGQSWADSGQMQYMNASALKNLSLSDSANELRDAGVSEKFVSEVERRAGAGKVDPDYMKTISRL